MTTARTGAEIKALLERVMPLNPSEFDLFLKQLVNCIPDDASPDNPLVTAASGADVGILDDVTSTIHVVKGAAPGGDGSQANPFNHPQDAADQILANGDASANNPYTLKMEGHWDFGPDYLHLPSHHVKIVGDGAHSTSMTADGLVVYAGNGSRASVESMISNDDVLRANLNANYANMVADGAYDPTDGVSFENLSIIEGDPAAYSVIAMNVGDGLTLDLIAGGVTFSGCRVFGSVYARNLSAFATKGSEIRYHAELRNIRSIYTEFRDIGGSVGASFVGAEPKPDGVTLSFWTGKEFHIGSNATLDDVSINIADSHFDDDLILNGPAALTQLSSCTVGRLVMQSDLAMSMIGGVIKGNLETSSPGTINATLTGVTIAGNANIAAGGTQAIVLNNSPVTGTVTDPDGAITYNAPTLGSGGAEEVTDTTEDMVVFSYHSGLASWANNTAAAQSESGSTFYFWPTAASGQLAYIGDTGRKFSGIKMAVSSAASATGVHVWEYWNGSAWTAFQVMATDLAAENQYGDNLLVRAQEENIRFEDFLANWATTSVNGTTAYWVRARITSNYVTVPQIESIAIHTSRTKRGDVTEYLGTEPLRDLPWHNDADDDITGNNPGDANIDFSANISVTAKDNVLANGATDQNPGSFRVPFGLDTSKPVPFTLDYIPSINGSPSDADLALRHTKSSPGDTVDGSLAETTVAKSESIGAADALVHKRVTFDLDLSGCVPGDLVRFSYERDGSGDAYSGDLRILDTQLQGRFWRD